MQTEGVSESPRGLSEAVKFIRILQELSRNMEAIEEHKTQDEPLETSAAPDNECTSTYIDIYNPVSRCCDVTLFLLVLL